MTASSQGTFGPVQSQARSIPDVPAPQRSSKKDDEKTSDEDHGLDWSISIDRFFYFVSLQLFPK